MTPDWIGAAPSRQRTTTSRLADCRRTFRAPYLAPQPIFVLRRWSEWQDLNLRPPRPERGVPPSLDQRLTNDIRELKANIRERSNRVRTRKALKMVGPGGLEPPTRPL